MRARAFGIITAIIAIAFFVTPAIANAAITATNATPANGAVLKGKVSWTANASSADGIKVVAFYINNRASWNEGLSPYVYGGDGATWSTTGTKDGAYQLKIVATSKKGEVATHVINVTVANTTTTTPPPAPTAPTTTPTAPTTTPTAPTTTPTAPTTTPTAPTTTPTAPTTTPTEPTTTPPPPPPPSDTASVIATDFSHVRVTWPAYSGAASTQIVRDGITLASRGSSVTQFVDSMLWEKTAYTYTIKHLSSSGATLATRGPLTAVTPALPAAGYPVSFAGNAIWTGTVAANAPRSPRNAEFMSYLTANLKNPNLTLRSYGVPIYQSEAGDATFGNWSCIYACNINSAGKVPIPDKAVPDPGTDHHMTVLSADGKTSWDYYKPLKNSAGVWSSTSAGVIVPMSGNGIVPKNLAGANAANMAGLAGLIRPEELAQGRIDHALLLGIPGIAGGAPACPATHNVGTTSAANAIPEGARLQLDPTLNVDALQIPAWQKTIARAMQKYGVYVRDNSGTIAIYAEATSATVGGRYYDGWNKTGLGLSTSSGSQGFSSAFPWSKLSVLDFKYGPDC